MIFKLMKIQKKNTIDLILQINVFDNFVDIFLTLY